MQKLNLFDGFDRPPLSARFGFHLDVPTIGDIGRFNEVKGLEVTMKTEDYAEGGQHGYVHKLPGHLEWPNITLGRGLTFSDNLFRWMERTTVAYRQGKAVDTFGGTIRLFDEAGEQLSSWSFADAIPVKWTGPTFSADSKDLATETLEIAHQGFRAREPHRMLPLA